jgi:hypothetical protein
MGTFLGHILPGTFFISFAIWWSFSVCLRYIQCRNRNANSKTCIKKYHSTVTMPCICCPTRIRNFPTESFIKVIATIIGILGEIVTGIKIHPAPSINIDTKVTSSNPMNMAEHHHDGKRQAIPTVEVTTWHFEGANAQHVTMYSAFLIGSIVELLMHYKVHLPQRLDHICGIFAFAAEGILFQFHLHGRDDLDIHIHTLLVIAIYGCVFTSILEYSNPHNVIFTYGRIIFTFLQGTWFYQAGFILYPPTKSLENRWDPGNHMHIMFVTMSYIWHFLLIFIGLLIQFIILNNLYGTKYSIVEDIEDAQQLEYLMINDEKKIHNHSNRKTNSLNETSLDNNFSDDESEIEFDNSKLVNKSNSTNTNSNTSDRKR